MEPVDEREPGQEWEVSDREFGLTLGLGLAVGIPLMFGVIILIALASGASVAVALTSAAIPAVVAGPYLGGLFVLGRTQAAHERKPEPGRRDVEETRVAA